MQLFRRLMMFNVHYGHNCHIVSFKLGFKKPVKSVGYNFADIADAGCVAQFRHKCGQFGRNIRKFL